MLAIAWVTAADSGRGPEPAGGPQAGRPMPRRERWGSARSSAPGSTPEPVNRSSTKQDLPGGTRPVHAEEGSVRVIDLLLADVDELADRRRDRVGDRAHRCRSPWSLCRSRAKPTTPCSSHRGREARSRRRRWRRQVPSRRQQTAIAGWQESRGVAAWRRPAAPQNPPAWPSRPVRSPGAGSCRRGTTPRGRRGRRAPVPDRWTCRACR